WASVSSARWAMATKAPDSAWRSCAKSPNATARNSRSAIMAIRTGCGWKSGFHPSLHNRSRSGCCEKSGHGWPRWSSLIRKRPDALQSPARRRSGMIASTSIIAGVDHPGVHAHRKSRDRLRRRRFLHFARPHVEARAVARTFDLESAHLAAGQFAAIVRAHVLDRIQVALEVVHGDRGVIVPHDLEFARQQLILRADFHPFTRHLTLRPPAPVP